MKANQSSRPESTFWGTMKGRPSSSGNSSPIDDQEEPQCNPLNGHLRRDDAPDRVPEDPSVRPRHTGTGKCSRKIAQPYTLDRFAPLTKASGRHPQGRRGLRSPWFVYGLLAVVLTLMAATPVPAAAAAEMAPELDQRSPLVISRMKRGSYVSDGTADTEQGRQFPSPQLENVKKSWKPVDFGNPMLDDSTMFYAPPALERVRMLSEVLGDDDGPRDAPTHQLFPESRSFQGSIVDDLGHGGEGGGGGEDALVRQRPGPNLGVVILAEPIKEQGGQAYSVYGSPDINYSKFYEEDNNRPPPVVRGGSSSGGRSSGSRAANFLTTGVNNKGGSLNNRLDLEDDDIFGEEVRHSPFLALTKDLLHLRRPDAATTFTGPKPEDPEEEPLSIERFLAPQKHRKKAFGSRPGSSLFSSSSSSSSLSPNTALGRSFRGQPASTPAASAAAGPSAPFEYYTEDSPRYHGDSRLRVSYLDDGNRFGSGKVPHPYRFDQSSLSDDDLVQVGLDQPQQQQQQQQRQRPEAARAFHLGGLPSNGGGGAPVQGPVKPEPVFHHGNRRAALVPQASGADAVIYSFKNAFGQKQTVGVVYDSDSLQTSHQHQINLKGLKGPEESEGFKSGGDSKVIIPLLRPPQPAGSPVVAGGGGGGRVLPQQTPVNRVKRVFPLGTPFPDPSTLKAKPDFFAPQRRPPIYKIRPNRLEGEFGPALPLRRSEPTRVRLTGDYSNDWKLRQEGPAYSRDLASRGDDKFVPGGSQDHGHRPKVNSVKGWQGAPEGEEQADQLVVYKTVRDQEYTRPKVILHVKESGELFAPDPGTLDKPNYDPSHRVEVRPGHGTASDQVQRQAQQLLGPSTPDTANEQGSDEPSPAPLARSATTIEDEPAAWMVDFSDSLPEPSSQKRKKRFTQASELEELNFYDQDLIHGQSRGQDGGQTQIIQSQWQSQGQGHQQSRKGHHGHEQIQSRVDSNGEHASGDPLPATVSAYSATAAAEPSGWVAEFSDSLSSSTSQTRKKRFRRQPDVEQHVTKDDDLEAAASEIIFRDETRGPSSTEQQQKRVKFPGGEAAGLIIPQHPVFSLTEEISTPTTAKKALGLPGSLALTAGVNRRKRLPLLLASSSNPGRGDPPQIVIGLSYDKDGNEHRDEIVRLSQSGDSSDSDLLKLLTDDTGDDHGPYSVDQLYHLCLLEVPDYLKRQLCDPILRQGVTQNQRATIARRTAFYYDPLRIRFPETATPAEDGLKNPLHRQGFTHQ